MDKIFQQDAREEVDLTIALFFYLNFISFNFAWSPLFIEMCRSLIERAPSGYVLPGSEKLRTILLVKAKKEVDKILEPIRSTWPSSEYCFRWMDKSNTPSTHQFHGIFPKWTIVLESGGCSWEIQGCTIYSSKPLKK